MALSLVRRHFAINATQREWEAQVQVRMHDERGVRWSAGCAAVQADLRVGDCRRLCSSSRALMMTATWKSRKFATHLPSAIEASRQSREISSGR